MTEIEAKAAGVSQSLAAGAVACDGHTIRYYYHGESPQDGRILRVPGMHAAPAEDAIRRNLASVADLTLFTPHVRSAAEEAFVPLAPAVDSDSALVPCGQDTRRVDICLYARGSSALQAPDTSLLCDSKAVGLTAAFFAVGILRARAVSNHGSVWRSALQFGAAYTFTVGAEYARRIEGSADVYKTSRQIPFVTYRDTAALLAGAPLGSSLVAVEYGGEALADFVHPRRAVYVFGDEKDGLPADVVALCSHHVSISTAEGRPDSLNVAAAAAIVMYDRFCKMGRLRRDPDGEP
jgi:tRNA(Leu) C34 or U34 (ribose-2'-O)-methylase TrmL